MGEPMPTKIGGFVLRCADKKITADFYAALGLTTTEHQHAGPSHFGVEPLADKKTEFIVEIYDASARYAKDAIIVWVDSIARALAIAKDFSIEPKAEIKVVNNFLRVYITDPDGRDVMLIQEQNQAQLPD